MFIILFIQLLGFLYMVCKVLPIVHIFGIALILGRPNLIKKAYQQI